MDFIVSGEFVKSVLKATDMWLYTAGHSPKQNIENKNLSTLKIYMAC